MEDVAAVLGERLEGYVEPRSADDLTTLGEVLRTEFPDGVPVLALGRGSNLVVADDGFPGVVVRMGPAFSWMNAVGEQGLDAGAATSLPLLANWTARRGLSGLEFTIAIPGSVGGAVRMNAGAHGGDVASVLSEATVFELADGGVEKRRADALGFSYRRSILTDREIVVEAVFDLASDDPGAVKSRVDE